MGLFGSTDRYHDQVQALLGTEVLLDKGMIYFDVRLSHRYPTVEIRVADVCLAQPTPRCSQRPFGGDRCAAGAGRAPETDQQPFGCFTARRSGAVSGTWRFLTGG